MTESQAAHISTKINASDAQPIRLGWGAAPKLVCFFNKRGLLDGTWYAVLHHPDAPADFLLASWDEWQEWLTMPTLAITMPVQAREGKK